MNFFPARATDHGASVAGVDFALSQRIAVGRDVVLGVRPHDFLLARRDDTGELHAPAEADPADQQAVSWCFALEHRPGEDHTGDKPARYDHWRTHVDPFWPGPQLSWVDVEPIGLRRPLLAVEERQCRHDGQHDREHRQQERERDEPLA